MPDGSLPQRELRFKLVTEDGRVDVFFTDTKGRFLFTRKEGLKSGTGYTITFETDKSTYDTTTVTFKLYEVFYIAVFLEPLPSITSATKPVSVVSLSGLKEQPPAEAREAYEGGLRAFKEAQTDLAIGELRRAISIYPTYLSALNDLGVILMKLGRLDEAAEVLAGAVEAAPSAELARLNLGIVMTKQGKYDRAIEMMRRLHVENSHLVQVLLPLADALTAAERLDEAEPYLREALASGKLEGTAQGEAHYKYGMLLSRKQRYREAVDQLSEAARMLPESAYAHLQLGGAALQTNQLDVAERELLEAYRLGGARIGVAQLLLGQLYFTRQRYKEAKQAFEQYLIDVPQAANAADVKGVIEKIKAQIPPE